MSGAIAAILLGSASMLFLICRRSVGCEKLTSKAEKRLWSKWVSACCLILFFSLIFPGLLEITGVIPVGYLSLAGAILCFLLIVKSGKWYCQRLSQLRRFASKGSIDRGVILFPGLSNDHP
jgi:hypothetical protein